MHIKTIFLNLILFPAPVFRPSVQQVYNLFHPTDPVSARIEPLLSARFSMLPPVNVSRYQKYPLGDGQPYHLCKFSSSFITCEALVDVHSCFIYNHMQLKFLFFSCLFKQISYLSLMLNVFLCFFRFLKESFVFILFFFLFFWDFAAYNFNFILSRVLLLHLRFSSKLIFVSQYICF